MILLNAVSIDWTSIIVTFITAGGFTAMLTIREKKTGLFMQNVEKVSAEWQRIADSRKSMYDDLRADYEKMSDKIDEQLKINSKLRHLLDDANTRAAVAKVVRCDKVNCANREPPLSNSIGEKYDSQRDIEKKSNA